MRLLLVFLSLLMLSQTAQAAEPNITVNVLPNGGVEFSPPEGHRLELQCPELSNVNNVTKLKVIKEAPRVYIVDTIDGQVLTPTTCQVRIR